MLQNALPAVVLLTVMVGIAWLLQRYRRHLPGAASQRGPGLQVMNSLSLGPQQRVVTVQVGEGESSLCLVLGVAPGGITHLHTQSLPAGAPSNNAPGAPVPPSGGFAARLALLVKPSSQGSHAPR